MSAAASDPPARKLPLLEPDTAFFWTSGEDGKLRIQRCRDCRHYQHPPLPRCPRCHSEAVGPEVVSGEARVASYTINYEPWLPGLQVPFVFAAVELAEQKELYVFTNILAPIDAVRIGQPVRVSFERHDDVWLPMFAPAETADV